jgi:hypothetical protein
MTAESRKTRPELTILTFHDPRLRTLRATGESDRQFGMVSMSFAAIRVGVFFRPNEEQR